MYLFIYFDNGHLSNYQIVMRSWTLKSDYNYIRMVINLHGTT